LNHDLRHFEPPRVSFLLFVTFGFSHLSEILAANIFQHEREKSRVMNRNWWSLGFRILVVLLVVLAMSHPGFADKDGPRPGAPEIDPRLAIEGLAVAGGVAALVWERIRRRRR
jgi:hypothetical protein